jgi:hypothetical protein
MSQRLCLLLLFLLATSAAAQEIQNLGRVSFRGEIVQPKELSAGAAVEDDKWLVIGSNEGTQVQVLRQVDASTYQAAETISLISQPTKQEIDIEGIAAAGRTVYVMGSHSLKRLKLEPKAATQAANRVRTQRSEREPLRESLFRFELDESGRPGGTTQRTSLRARLQGDVILRPFLEIPGKEGGVDIEGLAWREGKLWAGFRGPVLRDGYAVVLVFDFDRPDQGELRLVHLDGLGIRELIATRDGLLVLAGSVGEESAPIRAYFWDGKDQTPGSDVKVMPAHKLGTIPPPPNDRSAKSEGLVLLAETATYWDVLAIYDGAKDGAPTRFRLRKP